MDNKQAVAITIESVADGERIVLEAVGTLYRKSGSFYLRYEEKDELLGVSTVTVKAGGGEARLTRRGAVDSEMPLSPGQARSGHYRSAQLLMPLRVRCSSVDVQLDDIAAAPGRIAVAYELYADDALLGQYTVTFWIALQT